MRSRTAIVLGFALVAACAEAGGDVVGGELTTEGSAASAPAEFTPPDDGTKDECGTGTKWSEIYRDIFGPTGKAGSCSFNATCHGTPAGKGAQWAAGIQCYDEKGCRQSLFDHNLVTAGNIAHPAGATLFGFMRHRLPSGRLIGIMPKAPETYVFPPTCLARLQGWIAAGELAD